MDNASFTAISQLAAASLVAIVIVVAAGAGIYLSVETSPTTTFSQTSSTIVPSTSVTYTNETPSATTSATPFSCYSSTTYGNTSLEFCTVFSTGNPTFANSSFTYTMPASLPELTLEAALSSAVMSGNGFLTLTVNETNISNESIIITGEPGWVGDYCDGMNLPGAVDFPINIGMFRGYATADNISLTSPVYFHAQMMCPDYILSAYNSLPLYSFAPHSDVANVSRWSSFQGQNNFGCPQLHGQYCISYYLQLKQCCYFFHQSYDATNSSSLAVGQYTLKVFDMWGRTLLVHFAVL